MDNHVTPARDPKMEAQDTANILESLTNLIYLTKLEADRPEQVRFYMDLSAERVQAMVDVLHYRH